MTDSPHAATNRDETTVKEDLADRREFVLPSDRWTAFVALLDRAPRDLPWLRKLLTKPWVLDRRARKG